jgi:hypothetical protein
MLDEEWGWRKRGKYHGDAAGETDEDEAFS